MNTFVALVAISCLASLINAACPVYPPCKADETSCILETYSPNDCPPAPICIPKTSKYRPDDVLGVNFTNNPSNAHICLHKVNDVKELCSVSHTFLVKFYCVFECTVILIDHHGFQHFVKCCEH
jgi:hypothetical protein